jgi:hypothetical protein
MKQVHREALRFVLAAAIIAGACACADTKQYLQSNQGKAVMATSETIAHIAVTAAATTYGGPLAGQLAGAGLDALGAVLQGYIDKPVPTAIVQAAPGIKQVGKAVLPLIEPGAPITQADVNTVYKAAAIATKE